MPYLLLCDALVIGKIERKKNSKPFIRMAICAFQKSLINSILQDAHNFISQIHN